MNLYSDFSGSVSDMSYLQVIDVSGTLTFRLPSSRDWFMGASVGMAFGTVDSSTRLRIYGDASSNVHLEGDFSGQGPSLGAFLGYQGRVGRTGLVWGLGGERSRTYGTPIARIADGIARPHSETHAPVAEVNRHVQAIKPP